MMYDPAELPVVLVKAWNLRLTATLTGIQLVFSGLVPETKLNKQYVQMKTLGPLVTEGNTDDQITFVVRLECYSTFSNDIYSLDRLIGKAMTTLRGPIVLGIQDKCVRPTTCQVIKRGQATKGTDLEVAIVEAQYSFELER